MTEAFLEINLFGACVVRGAGGYSFEVSGSKHKALFVLLATAPLGRRTRSYLQEILWGVSCYDSGRQSLRKALSDIKRILGEAFDKLIITTNSDIALNLELVKFLGKPGGSQFLEGLDIRETQFETWVNCIRQNPGQLYSLYSLPGAGGVPSVTPAVTILPFQLIKGNKDDLVICDWVAEEICRSLSRTNLISVISHLSARALTTSSIELSAVREKLNVDYCLTGSVRIDGQKILLDADFLDAHTGKLLWTRHWSGNIGDVMDEWSVPISELVQSVGRAIASEAIQHVKGRALEDISEQKMLIASVGLMHQLKLSSFAKSKQLLDELAIRSPYSAETHAWLAEWYVLSVFNGWSTNAKEDKSAAVDHIARALDIDPENAFSLTINGVVNNNLLQRFDVAENLFDEALRLNPNESLSWLFSGVLHAFRDEGKQAVAKTEKAMRLSPLDPMGYFFESLMSTAYLSAKDFGRALFFADRSLIKNDRHTSTHRVKICALYHLGKIDEAKEVGVALMKRQPEFTVNDYVNNHPASNFEVGKLMFESLRGLEIPTGEK